MCYNFMFKNVNFIFNLGSKYLNWLFSGKVTKNIHTKVKIKKKQLYSEKYSNLTQNE